MTPHLWVPKAKPDFEAFLFASIGEDDNGMALSVLSGLSRMNVDAWDEAARLSQMPRERAIEALGHRISQLPRGAWRADAREIATRLVDLLPRQDAEAHPGPVSSPTLAGPGQSRAAIVTLWLIAAGIAASLLFGLPARVERLLGGESIVMPLIMPEDRSAPRH